MIKLILYLITFSFLRMKCIAQTMHEADVNFRVDAGSRTCIFEKGKAGQMMEAYYQVLDGQHGDLDITFEILDPNGEQMVSDYKKSQNSIIRDLEVDGDYVFCLDNTYSIMNSKLVYLYVMIEDKEKETNDDDYEAKVTDDEKKENGEEEKEKEILEWEVTGDNGEIYYLEVDKTIVSLKKTLKHVLKARHLLDVYGAMKSRDSYIAFEDTFVVDVWSAFQISIMFAVGMLQVFMIKQLFNKSGKHYLTTQL